ncbi:hypothetical protein ACN47E_007586 [Coniothyrium glycines]
MAEVFGAVAAGIALTSQLIKIGKSIRETIKGIQHTRQDVTELADEVIIFAGLYRDFLRTCSNDLKANASTALSAHRLEIWTKSIIHKFRDIVRDTEALIPKKSRCSVSESFKAHWKWFFSSSFVDGLRASLRVARETINAFTSLSLLKKLNSHLDLLRQALHNSENRQLIEEEYGMDLEEKIMEVEQDMKNTSQVYHTTKRYCQRSLKTMDEFQRNTRSRDVVPEQEALYGFAQSFEDYAEEVVYSMRSSRRRTQASGNTTRTGSSSATHESGSSRSVLRSVESQATSSLNHTLDDTSNASSSNYRPPFPRKSLSATHNFEHRGPSKEYMNDPSGTIISGPKAKANSALFNPSTPSGPVLHRHYIGSHVIELRPHNVHVNEHLFYMTDPGIAQRFYEALLSQNDKLDELDGVLRQRPLENRNWCDLEGWMIDLSGAAQSVLYNVGSTGGKR